MMDSFDSAQLYSLTIAALNGVVHGYTGFGGALLMVPLLTFLFGPVKAIAIVGIIIIFGSVQLYPWAARRAQWRELLPIFIGIAMATPIGIYFLFTVDPILIRRSMGAFILIFALILMSGWVYRGPRGIGPSTFVGVLSGGITGLSGVGGPPLALYYLASLQPVETQRANIMVSVAFLTLTMLTLVALGGAFSENVVLRALILTPAYMIGVWGGTKLFALVPKDYFRAIALWLLVAIGIWTIAK